MTTPQIAGSLLMFAGVLLLLRATIIITGRTPGLFRLDGLTGLFAAIALIAIGRILVN